MGIFDGITQPAPGPFNGYADASKLYQASPTMPGAGGGALQPPAPTTPQGVVFGNPTQPNPVDGWSRAKGLYAPPGATPDPNPMQIPGGGGIVGPMSPGGVGMPLPQGMMPDMRAQSPNQPNYGMLGMANSAPGGGHLDPSKLWSAGF